MQGPPGERGLVGATGLPGSSGVSGPVGLKGDKGEYNMVQYSFKMTYYKIFYYIARMQNAAMTYILQGRIMRQWATGHLLPLLALKKKKRNIHIFLGIVN